MATTLDYPINGTSRERPGCLERYCPSKHDESILLPQLTELLKRSIEGGASMTFVPPVSSSAIETLWRNTLKDPKRTLFLWLVRDPGHDLSTAEPRATDSWKLAGTVVLLDIATGTGPFRAKVEKLMVAPEFQRLGIAEALMAALEAEALGKGLYYITLGTESGCPADKFYRKIGYTVEGVLPEYIVSARDGTLVGCAHFYKRLRGNV